MELIETIEKRASVRQFTNEEVKAEDLKEIVRLAGLAPSVNNSQPWYFIAITNKELLNNMQECVKKKIDEVFPDEKADKKIKSQVSWFSTFFAEAPAVIAVLRKPYEAVVDKILYSSNEMTHEDINLKRNFPDIQSIGACIENILLASVDLGYGACWLSGPLIAKKELEECLSVKEPWSLAAMVAVGRGVLSVKQKDKKTLEEIFELRS